MSPIDQKENVEEHFDEVAKKYDYWKNKNWYYYETIKSFIGRIIPEGASVLEVGCGTGEILASVKPSRGVGIDISSEMTKIAARKFPQYDFIHAPIEELKINEKFDYVIMVDVVDHVYDVMDVFENLFKFCKPTTQIILTTINPWWDPILMLMEKIGAKMPEGPHNFIEKRNLSKMVELLDFSISYSGYMLLFPKYIPVLSFLANSLGTRMWGISKCSAVQYMIIQPTVKNKTDLGYGCSVIIPCYNEAGNIEEAVKRVPQMGRGTEVVVVNDGSKDKTAEIVRGLQLPHVTLIDYSPNRGKGNAVKAGFDAAQNEVIMILDADISTPPEELPRFFNPLNQGRCQFVNGTRLVYPMQEQAMRTLNLFGNKLFGMIMSFITQQHLTDTLCGTKALLKSDFKRMSWGLDKWGDFDLLFGAAKIGSKIMEVPVHYKSRKADKSKMNSFRHGLHLLRACFLGFRELVFVKSK
jgi:ubiquinone/menaquinone biosynthesis C-methylase UbiE